MKGKLKILAASFLIVLTLSLGTFLTLAPGAFANNSYSSLGLIYALNSIEQNPQRSGLDLSANLNFPTQSSGQDLSVSLSSIQDVMNQALMRLELQKIQSSDLDISASLNFSTDLNIENLTSDQIKAAKQSIENVTSRAFMKWQLEKMLSGELKPFVTPPSNESVREMFFQFLSERPDCAERFAQYDKMLSRENQLQTNEQVLEFERSFQNVNLVVEKGEILREWNTTQTINGLEYFVVNREYAMNVNGTIQKVVKVYVYSYDGKEIIDPYMGIQWVPLLWPCMVWVFWWPFYVGWWGTVILYGYDFYLYTAFTVDEQGAYAYWVYDNTLGQVTPDWYTAAVGINDLIGAAIYAASQGAAGITAAVLAAAGAACVALAVALAVAWPIFYVFVDYYWNNFVSTEAYNFAINPYFGFREVTYFHDPISPPTGAYPSCYDLLPYITPFYIRADNSWWYKLLWPYSVMVDKYTPLWYALNNFVTVWGGTFGFNTWVWLSPFPPNWPPPPPI
nr:hypothetical protein [Candidatus Freyarchaeota archaeon]